MPLKPSNKILCVAGGLLSFLGVLLCYLYIDGAIIERAGEADQSLVFWYLPFLFAGLFFLVGGLGLLAAAWYRARQDPR